MITLNHLLGGECMDGQPQGSQSRANQRLQEDKCLKRDKQLKVCNTVCINAVWSKQMEKGSS